tara:strand:- start:1004 stop:1375 length:372 start_codon:yes stop_codon:yes gene_type:complete
MPYFALRKEFIRTETRQKWYHEIIFTVREDPTSKVEINKEGNNFETPRTIPSKLSREAARELWIELIKDGYKRKARYSRYSTGIADVNNDAASTVDPYEAELNERGGTWIDDYEEYIGEGTQN